MTVFVCYRPPLEILSAGLGELTQPLEMLLQMPVDYSGRGMCW
jgi:hypothetical protein